VLLLLLRERMSNSLHSPFDEYLEEVVGKCTDIDNSLS